MATFQPDTSFRRRTRGRGGERRPLAAVLDETGGRPAGGTPLTDVLGQADAAAPAAAATAMGDDAPPASEPAPSPEPAPEPGEPAAAEPPPPSAAAALTLGDDELAALLAGAAAEAHGAAREAAEAAGATKLAEATASIAAALTRAADDAERRRGADATLVLELVRGITRHVAPHAVAAAPLDDLAAELPALLARIEGPERITIAVHPDLEAELAARLDGVRSEAGFTGEIEIRADADVAPGDAVVNWPAGEARRSLDARLAEATRLCAGWLAERESTAPTPTPEETDEP
jgi:flagellar biosynthesis/type III secretory pathway protein FliH